MSTARGTDSAEHTVDLQGTFPQAQGVNFLVAECHHLSTQAPSLVCSKLGVPEPENLFPLPTPAGPRIPASF